MDDEGHVSEGYGVSAELYFEPRGEWEGEEGKRGEW